MGCTTSSPDDILSNELTCRMYKLFMGEARNNNQSIEHFHSTGSLKELDLTLDPNRCRDGVMMSKGDDDFCCRPAETSFEITKDMNDLCQYECKPWVYGYLA